HLTLDNNPFYLGFPPAATRGFSADTIHLTRKISTLSKKTSDCFAIPSGGRARLPLQRVVEVCHETTDALRQTLLPHRQQCPLSRPGALFDLCELVHQSRRRRSRSIHLPGNARRPRLQIPPAQRRLLVPRHLRHAAVSGGQVSQDAGQEQTNSIQVTLPESVLPRSLTLSARRDFGFVFWCDAVFWVP